MAEREEQVAYFARVDYRGQERRFGIKAKDRTKHVYVVGKTGMGKSTLLENMAAQDILNGNGMAFIDPHGSAVETLLRYIPKERIDDVIYFAPFDLDHPVSFNIMEDVGPDKRHLVVSGLMGAFKKIWKDQWSSRMEYILTNTLLALIEFPGSTLLDVNVMLTNKIFRKKVLEHVTDPVVKSFWVDEFANFSDKYAQEATPAIQNKIGQFISNPIVRNIVGQSTASFDFRKAMDERKIVIMNLSKGRMGEQNADLIGSMLVIKIYLAAMSRADLPPHEIAKLPNFYLYVDEFQSFANDTFANILSEARKYKLNLTIAHQYIEQMPEEVRFAVFGNVGTMIFFRVGAIDAELIEKELAPTFTGEDLVNLGIYQIYLKLMIDGLTSAPFSATTLPPVALPERSYVSEVIAASRAAYARPRAEIEAMIKKQKEDLAALGAASGGDKKKTSDRGAVFTPASSPHQQARPDSATARPAPVAPWKRPVSNTSPATRSSLGDHANKSGGHTPVPAATPLPATPRPDHAASVQRSPSSPLPRQGAPALSSRPITPPRAPAAPRAPLPVRPAPPPHEVRRDSGADAETKLHQPFRAALHAAQSEQSEVSEAGGATSVPQSTPSHPPAPHAQHAQHVSPRHDRTVSLNHLAKRPTKEASPNSSNMSALRGALAAALKDAGQASPASAPIPPSTVPHTSPLQPHTPPATKTPATGRDGAAVPPPAEKGIPEIPEPVLRKTLRVDDAS